MKKKGQLGTFGNGGLSTGFAFFEISDEDMAKMSQIVIDDLKNIEEDFLIQYERIKGFISNEIGAIQNDKEFAKWFFDRKKINEWGKHLPNITDDDIIEGAKEYYQYLKKKLNEEEVKQSI